MMPARQHQIRRHPHGFILAPRGDTGLELLRASRTGFILIFIIAQRARWRNGFNEHGLGPGQAMLGDFERCGMTQREYRSAKHFLQKHGFATFEATTRGTIATLTSTEVFDINIAAPDDQNDRQTTSDRRATDERPTTNEERNKETRGERSAQRGGKPSLREVQLHAAKAGGPEWLATSFFADMERSGWRDRHGQPVATWRGLLVHAVRTWEAKGRKPAPPTPSPTGAF